MTESKRRRTIEMILVNRNALLFIVERVVAAPDLEVMRALIPGLFCENTGRDIIPETGQTV